MKALILNSGQGTRMLHMTEDTPKCMVKVNDQTLLEHQLEHLQAVGVTDLIITTGPHEEQITGIVAEKFPNLNVKYVNNPDYKTTNYIYSMYLVKDLIDDEFLLIHGDMVFDRELLKRLIASEHENAVLMNNKLEPPKKDFKGRVEDGIVKEIGVDVLGEGCFFLPPVYKFSQQGMQRWMQEIEVFIKKGENGVYAENAFNDIPEEINLTPVYYGEEFCMEIDDLDDLKIARKHLENK